MNKQYDIVIYHANCPDGTGAAWCFYRQWPTADYIPKNYGDAPPDVTGKTVAIVDFSFPRAVLANLAAVAKQITILDHHKSAKEDLATFAAPNVTIVFDMLRSGAQIAWDYLYPDTPQPWFVKYIADRDLWKFEMPATEEINQVLHFDGWLTLKRLSDLHQTMLSPPPQFVERGSALLEFRKREIEKYSKQAIAAKLTVGDQEYTVGLCFAPRDIRSDVGAAVVENKDYQFAAVYYYDLRADMWYISLRGRKGSPCDLSKISAAIPNGNGGGHYSAAGFQIAGQAGLRSVFSI